MTTILTIDSVGVELGGRRVLNDVSFEVGAGQFIGLIGPNGAGKTTLMRAVNQLIPVQSGQIERAPKLRIGYVPQYRNIDWEYPVSLEQVVMTSFAKEFGLFGRPKREHWRAVYRALEQVDLLEYRSRTLAELSGGQKQRVLLARALATDPALLLLDEPFTGLDHPNQDALAGVFTELADRGVAIIMSTHDLGQAIDICSDLAMLNRTLHAFGSPSELRDAELWMHTFQVAPGSALLRSLGMIAA